MLSEKQKAYFRMWLTERLNESLGKAQETLDDLSGPKDRLCDVIDQAAFCSDLGFALRITDREAKLIGKIKDALQRLDDGTFGVCEECGEKIPVRRLMARPVATLCLRCKKEQEAAERVRDESSQVSLY